MHVLRSAAIIMAAALSLAAGGCARRGHGLPGHARGTVDTALGAYRGVRVGTPIPTVRVFLGAPLSTNNTTFIAPADQPPFLPADGPYDWIYPDVRFTFAAGRVASITVYGRGATSDRGVGVGSTLAQVRGAYPGARCQAARTGLNPRAAGCEAHPSRTVYAYFGGDPVLLIALSALPVIP